MSTKDERREILKATVSDCVSDLLYYGRKEDEDLELGAIDKMVADGEVTIEEMVGWFAAGVREHFDHYKGLADKAR